MNKRARRAAVVAAAVVAATVSTSGTAVAAPAPGVPAGSFYTEVINRDSGKCMNVRHGSSDWGAAIQEYHCDHTPAAKFLFRDMGADPSGAEWYQIENQDSRYCVAPPSWGDARPDPLTQGGCTAHRVYQWKLTPQMFGYYTLTNHETGKCIATPGWSRDDWTQLVEETCSPGFANEQWWLKLG